MPGASFKQNNDIFDQNAPVLINGQLSMGNAAFIDAATSGTTWTCAININAQLGSGGPLSGFVQINAGQPYIFTAAQAAQLIAAGVPLVAT